MRDSDWLKLNLRLIFLICDQTQILCNGAYSQLRTRRPCAVHLSSIENQKGAITIDSVQCPSGSQ